MAPNELIYRSGSSEGHGMSPIECTHVNVQLRLSEIPLDHGSERSWEPIAGLDPTSAIL